MKNPRKNKTPASKIIPPPSPLISGKKAKWQDHAAKALLLAFGFWMSFHFFSFLASPNPDFPCFTQLSRQLLSLHLPTDYKRVPMHGFLVVLISQFTQSSSHPELTAGWILCAILYPFAVLLVYLIGKQFIGRWAIWPALISAIHPWFVEALIDPIAEMTLTFFILLTFYFLINRSRWVYLFASIASMVRYEAAALILAAFVWDMIEAGEWRRRSKAFIFSALACVPLFLWAIGTVIMWKSASNTHYIKEMGEASGGKFVFFEFVHMLWQSGFSLLFLPAAGASADTMQSLQGLLGFLMAVGFGFGVIYGLAKRDWKVLMLLIFLLPYICIHAAHSFLVPRFGVPVNWLILLTAMYGFYNLFRLINKNDRIPRPLIIGVQIITILVFTVWFFDLYPYLKDITPASRNSAPLPYIVLAVGAIFVAISAWLYRLKFLSADIAAFTIMAVIAVSNQYSLAQRIGNGDLDVEFKYLTDWYRANAKPGERMLTSMAGNCDVFDPANQACYVHISAITAHSPQEFAEDCYRKNITYVTWDTRTGAAKGGRYYNLWHFDCIDQLANAKSVGPYEYITTIKGSSMYGYTRVVNIYRLKKPAVPIPPAVKTP